MKQFLLCLLAVLLFVSQKVSAQSAETFAYYESAFPHCAVYEVYHTQTDEVSYRVHKEESAPWESRFFPYLWETKIPYRIVEKRFTNLPDAGWVMQEENPQMGIYKEQILRVGADYEPVIKTYRPFGFNGWRVVGENRIAPAGAVYDTYPGKIAPTDWSQFTAEALSKKNQAGDYLVSDQDILDAVSFFDSAYLTGRDYATDETLTIDVAKEILLGKDPALFDRSVLQPSAQKPTLEWVVFCEDAEPYRQYEVLCLNSILLDGRVENGIQLPHIYRYNGLFGIPQQETVTYDSAEIFVFTYHWVSPKALYWGDYTIPQEYFREDIRYLYENGFYFATPQELYQMKENYPAEKIAVITFDDGYESCYTEALPVLEQYGAKATVFLVGSYIGTPDYLSEEELNLLAQSPHIELGNHSYQLHNLPRDEVARLYRDDIDTALADYYQNEEYIFSVTKKQITALSYPYGVYTTRLDNCIKDHGYEVTFSTRAANNHSINLKKPLNRLNRSFETTLEELLHQFGK